MAEIQLRNVSKRWGSFVGVDQFDLTIPDQEFLVLLGPSGCGKTTTMRMIAGLEDPTEGDIFIDGKRVKRPFYHIDGRLASCDGYNEYMETSDEVMESVALARIGPVYHRTEYAAWLQDVHMVQLAPREAQDPQPFEAAR